MSNTTTLPMSLVVGVGTPETTLWFAGVIIRTILVIFMFIWRDVQPVKSRYPVPIIASFCYFIGYDTGKFLGMLFTPFNFNNQGMWQYANVWPAYSLTIRMIFNIVFLLMFSFGVGHQFVKYFVFRILDDAKLTNRKMKRVKLLRFIASNWVPVIVITLQALILLPIGLLLVLAGTVWNTVKLTNGLLIMSILVGVIGLSLLPIGLSIWAWDIVRAIKQKEGIVHYFGEGDPFNFRIDAIFGLIAVVIGTASLLLNIIPTTGPEISNPSSIGIWIFSRALYLVVEVAILFVSGFSVVVSVAKMKIKLALQREDPEEKGKETSLEKILRIRGKYLKLFEEYCKSEFSSENLLCYQQLGEYKKKLENCTSIIEAHTLAKDIYEVFVQEGTLMEVNVPDKVRLKYANLMQNTEVSKEAIAQIFDELEYELLLNLSDSFMRFQFTPSFAKVRHSKSFR